MTNEKMYEHICAMLQEYDLHTGSQGADGVISNPEKWVSCDYFPFYASAAEMLIEARARMDTKTTTRTQQNAVGRIIKSCPDTRPNMCGLFSYGNRFVVVDDYRMVRLKDDISSLPHVENDFDVASVMKGVGPTTETLQIPTIGELRAFMAAHKVKYGKKTIPGPYCLNYFIWCNPHYLIDMIQSLPGCTAYKPSNPTDPIYFTADNGDGILLPVRPPEAKREKPAA